MRFIDLELIKPHVRHLLPALEEAQEQLRRARSEDERADIIRRNRLSWVALREEFDQYSHGKCWYTECTNPGTDDDIDHFRPKLGVKEAEDHPGYYWLAFDWTNLRLSCHRANRPRTNPETGETGGKAEHFPLVYPADRAYGPDDDWHREFPALLDPTNPADPPMISFLINGEVGLAPFLKGDAIAEKRFEYTRIYLHLNWPKFRDSRLMLYNQISRTVDRCDREAPRSFAEIGAASLAFKDAIRDLLHTLRPESEYSAAARAYVETFSHVWWVRDIVLRVAQ